MSQAYQCDRCYKTYPGKPNLTLALGDGIERVRIEQPADEFHGRPGAKMWDDVKDLCPECREQLREWWANATGDKTLSLPDPKEANE